MIAANAALAFAAATALGNRVRSAADLETCFDFLRAIDAVEAGLVILGDRMGMWGALPPLIRSEIDPELVTRGRRGP